MKTILALGLLLGAVAVAAQEQIRLTSSVTTVRDTWKITSVTLDIEGRRVEINLKSNDGQIVQRVYNSLSTPTGQTILSALNTANLSTRSLDARIYDRLIADGVFVGAVEGSPR